MFAQWSVYVSELSEIVWVWLICWDYTDIKYSRSVKSVLWRYTYSFNAHAMEHVENILCWNIARWTLSVRATSQASYCRIHHTDPHLQGHTTETFSTSTQASPQVKIQEQRSLFCWIVLPSAARLARAAVVFYSCLGELWAYVLKMSGHRMSHSTA